MKPRQPDPRALDVAAFAAQGGVLEGEWPLDGMPRLAGSAHDGTALGSVAWRAEGERTPARGREPQVWLRLVAAAPLALTCQRCLEAVDVRLDVDRRFGFVADEAQATAIDAEIDDDVLVLQPTLDLHTLVEDELLLALPLVPMHEDCTPPALVKDGGAKEEAAEHPFARLASLKRGTH